MDYFSIGMIPFVGLVLLYAKHAADIMKLRELDFISVGHELGLSVMLWLKR